MPASTSLFVTLADANYLQQVKQLFASVYFNSGWSGDYLLLAHDVPDAELEWFSTRGILTRQCAPFFKREKIGGYSTTLISKLYLFTSWFKQWQYVVYLDGDTMVRASIDDLLQVKGFSAVKAPLRGNFHTEEVVERRKLTKLFESLKAEYNLRLAPPNMEEFGFNAGLMAFNSDFVDDSIVDRFLELAQCYQAVCRSGDQAIFNLMFREQLEPIPPVFNVYPSWLNRYQFPPDEFDGIIYHFTRYRPWSEDYGHTQIEAARFQAEWRHNLERADTIDLNHRPPAARRWTREEIEAQSSVIRKYLLR